jgi:hypothetical protein
MPPLEENIMTDSELFLKTSCLTTLHGQCLIGRLTFTRSSAGSLKAIDKRLPHCTIRISMDKSESLHSE